MSCVIVLEGELRSRESLKIIGGGSEHAPELLIYTFKTRQAQKCHIYSLTFYLFF